MSETFSDTEDPSDIIESDTDIISSDENTESLSDLSSDNISDNEENDEIEENNKKNKKKKIVKKKELENQKVNLECIYNNIQKEKKKNLTTKIDKPTYLYKPIKGEIDKRKTKKILYKYEYVKVISDRIKQLDNGAKPMIKNSDNLSSREIAELELKTKIEYIDENNNKILNCVLPFKIFREMPNNIIEVFNLGELEILF